MRHLAGGQEACRAIDEEGAVDDGEKVVVRLAQGRGYLCDRRRAEACEVCAAGSVQQPLEVRFVLLRGHVGRCGGGPRLHDRAPEARGRVGLTRVQQLHRDAHRACATYRVSVGYAGGIDAVTSRP
jgi:hypothetical protein